MRCPPLSFPWMWLVWSAGGVVALVLLDRALLAAERRGWIYYRKARAPKGMPAPAATPSVDASASGAGT